MATVFMLDEPEASALLTLVQRTGRSADELVREAVQRYIQQQIPERRALLKQARGMWQQREDLPSVADLRREFDHRME